MHQSKENSVLLLFIDGLGIGDFNNDNSLARAGCDPLAYFKDRPPVSTSDSVMVSTDPRLGVEGRPQSASGQTTILTGMNAPKLLGYHKLGFPNRQLREVIKEHSIFRQLENNGIGPNVFANAYTPGFFEKRRWKSATTCAVEASAVQFRRLPDLIAGKALFHDFTNEGLVHMGYDVPIISAADAAKILADLVHANRFTLFEHFLTDMIGHKQDLEAAVIDLEKLAEFVRETVCRIDLETTTVILTSDHGNIEDLSVRNHTLNDVPTIIWGRKRDEAAAMIEDLSHITPAILYLLGAGHSV